MIGMKTCSRCNFTKDLTDFKKDVRYSQGVTGVCKECYKAYARANKAVYNWVVKNRERSNEIKDKYVKNNQETVKQSKRKWYDANPKKRLANVRVYQAAKKNGIPKWLTKEQRAEMQQFYINCPEGYEVDHIIPLRGKNVCGFHVPSNLQYLPISENRKKSNKVT